MVVQSLLDIPGEYIEQMDVCCSQEFMKYKEIERKLKTLRLLDSKHPFEDNTGFYQHMHRCVVDWGNAKVSFPLFNFVYSQLAMPHTDKSIILWSFALVDIFRRVNHLVTFNDLTSFFPFGFPGQQGIDYMWWQQHVDGKDLLNDPATWEHQSFCFPSIELVNAEVSVT